MRLMVLTQSLDLDDPVLGFAHGWMEALAAHLDHLIVAPLRAGRNALPANAEVRSLGKEQGGGTIARLGAFRRVVGEACRQREVDAILAHMVPRYAVYAAPFAVPRRIPVFLWYTHKGVDWSLRMAEPIVRLAFTASAESFRLPSKKKRVTGHGIDTHQFSPPGPGDVACDRDLAVVGRIAPSKDPLCVIEALGMLKAEGRVLRTLFAGDTLLTEHDAYKARVRERVAELGLEGQIEMLGAVPHHAVRDVFLRAPMFVTPSLTGSVDKTVLEAMACGRLALTCNESFRDIFGDHAARLMFAKGDAAGLAARLAALMDLAAAERDRLASALRSEVERNHDLDRLAARMVSEMAAVVTERGPMG